ncbi:Eukaryotic translation initiation factor 4E-1 [Cardamine amara subsp. amara]|uniref:Eukaryotic translation initiation factor 4E-1 n=1 Tax=Cardamine amara subsp. amara TaxID=228776 RepID=A0ABD1A1D6_CARAN
MAVEDTPKPVVNEEANPNSIENPIDRYHEEGDDTEEGEIVGGEGDGDVDESSKSAIPQSHPLEHSWTFWFDNPSVKSKQTIWGTSLRSVFTFSTVEEFWSLYNNMRHPSKWTMTFPKEKSDKSWLYTLLALIGEQFDHGDEICGAVVNIRGKQERISIWTKNFSNEAAQVSIGKQWKEFLDYNSSIGFIIHEDAKKLDRGAAKNAYTA